MCNGLAPKAYERLRPRLSLKYRLRHCPRHLARGAEMQDWKMTDRIEGWKMPDLENDRPMWTGI